MKILHVVGARPNFIKIAPLLSALARKPGVEQYLVHTGQHYDLGMSELFFRDLHIPAPDVNLAVGSGTHAVQTAAVMAAFEPVVKRYNPTIVVVVGDVNSTLACALVAAKLHVPVAHVEAGLRSRDRGMPEEINRVLTDQLADVLLTPSRDASENLRSEGIPEWRIHFVGNIMIDTLLTYRQKAMQLDPGQTLGLDAVARGRLQQGEDYLYVTLHRPSNVDDPSRLREIYGALSDLASRELVIFSMHPRTRRNTTRFGFMSALDDVRLVEPLPYLESLRLIAGARLVLTDSGGIQEETTALGVPCVTLRSTTERPITIVQGTNRLAPDRTKEEILKLVSRVAGRRECALDQWDGRTAGRIADVLVDWHRTTQKKAFLVGGGIEA